MEILKLNLVKPLYYIPVTDNDPFAYPKSTEYTEESGGKIYCFELDDAERLSFEPNVKKFPGRFIFAGVAVKGGEAEAAGDLGRSGEALLELPSGDYLFFQEREILGRDEIIEAAIEMQLEGLWQRLKPGKRLYLRYLFEDGKAVTQLFRPYS